MSEPIDIARNLDELFSLDEKYSCTPDRSTKPRRVLLIQADEKEEKLLFDGVFVGDKTKRVKFYKVCENIYYTPSTYGVGVIALGLFKTLGHDRFMVLDHVVSASYAKHSELRV